MDRGYTEASFSSTGDGPPAEDYVYNGKVIHIEWNLYSTGMQLVKKALIDNGMLLAWIGEAELPDVSNMVVEYLNSGNHKTSYKIYFESELPFVFGYVHNDTQPLSVEEQFNTFFIPVDNYWKDKILRGEIPIPPSGMVISIEDPYDEVVKEVFTRGFLDGYSSLDFLDFMVQKLGEPERINILNLIVREESASLYMIWKGAGQNIIPKDLKSANVIFEEDNSGVYTAKYFDFDYAVYDIETLANLFSHLKGQLLPLNNYAILLGFFDAMRLDGMRVKQILGLFDTLTGVDADAVAEAKAIIESENPIDWIEGFPDETREIKNYARLNIENALYAQGLLYNICLEGNIDIGAVSEIFGVFGVAGEYCYEYLMVIKTADSKFYYFDVSVLKEGLNPGAYNVNAVVNFRNSLYFQDPSLTGTSFGAVLTDMGMPVEAHQSDEFCYNLPPQMFTDLMLGEEIVTWWSEKYLQAAEKVGFLDALEIASLSNNGVPWVALESMFGVPQDTLLSMVGDVNTITGDYPDIFAEIDFKNFLKNKKLTHFDAYTIWYMSYILGKSTLALSKLYNIQDANITTIAGRVTSLYVPVDLIEERLRSEWRSFFDSVKLINQSDFATFDLYYKHIITELYLPFTMANTIRIPRTIDINYFLGVTHTYVENLKKADPEFGGVFGEARAYYTAKIRLYKKRFWKVRYNNFYADIQVNPNTNHPPRISPYDIDEVLGVLSEIGEDGKPMIERATGFARNAIKEITTNEASSGYGTDEITIYEIVVTKSAAEIRKFWLHLQKESAPSIVNAFNDLVTLQDQCIYDELYGMGQDSYTGRAGYATEEGWLYISRARLVEKGYAEIEINQIELNLIKSLYASTIDEGGTGWVVTDPGAIGFIQVEPGMYKAKLADSAKIAKGYTYNAMVSFYTKDAAWASRAFIKKDFGIIEDV
ncbi:MAG: hypothetical protein KAQ99_08045, partial [Candidatus Aureabacteria bacterium]|nr:hypothetical protein [Candidatus Auribacterota bacterium]